MTPKPHTLHRRQALCCGAAAVTGLFSSLVAPTQAHGLFAQGDCGATTPPALLNHPLVQGAFEGLDPAALWDVHAHLLGTGDSGSGCRVDPRMAQWWHPVEALRKKAILQGACVPADAASVDLAYVQRLVRLAKDFPAGARWLLYAFDSAHDDAGMARERWTTFHVPNRYAAHVASERPERFGWVASVHPYREDALARLDQACAHGAVALKWLPSAMNIDLMAPRLAPFYAQLARHGLPLIVHCGEEKAVPGARRDELGNPLRVRAPLQAGVRVVVAHCASLGEALDLDQRRPEPRPTFELFARLMEEPAWQGLLLGDVSALFQVNRHPEVWRTVLARRDWHARLLHGSDYPLPGVGPLYRLGPLVAAGLISPDEHRVLEALRPHNPLLFDLVLKRSVRWQGQGLAPAVFDTRRHFAGAPSPALTVRPHKMNGTRRPLS